MRWTAISLSTGRAAALLAVAAIACIGSLSGLHRLLVRFGGLRARRACPLCVQRSEQRDRAVPFLDPQPATSAACGRRTRTASPASGCATGRAYRLRPTGRAKRIKLSLKRRGETLPTNQQVVFPESLSCQDTRTTMTCNQDYGLGEFKLTPSGSHAA